MSALGWPGAPAACAAAVEINQSILQCPRNCEKSEEDPREKAEKTSSAGAMGAHPETAGVGKERRIIHTAPSATIQPISVPVPPPTARASAVHCPPSSYEADSTACFPAMS